MTDDELNLAAAKLLGYRKYRFAPVTGRGDEGFSWWDNPADRQGVHGSGIIEASDDCPEYSDGRRYLPSPATDIADAMRVVEHLRAKGVDLDIFSRRGEWRVGIGPVYICDPSLPRALTLAAVRAGEKGSA